MKEKLEESEQLTKRTIDDKKYLTKRLSIIEGQVRGVKQMIDNDRYCGDVLIQIAAINSSLKNLGSEILKNHLSTCVVNDIKQDHLEVIDEVMDLFKRLS